jgi:TRAP transporter TAXI family solute receptor
MRLLLALAVLLCPLWASASGLFIASVGTADYQGGYFKAGRALCERVNLVDRGALRCSPEATAGSIYNIRALQNGQLDFGIAQSDWSHHAVHGTSVFRLSGPDIMLRAVATLHDEPVTLLAAPGSTIRSIADLAGRSADLGQHASGRRATVLVALSAFGLSPDDLGSALELNSSASVEALCDGRIEATLLTLGHPSALVADAITRCGARLLPVTGPGVEAMQQTSPYYFITAIPAGTYPGQDNAILTVGVRALLLTRASLDSGVVEAFTRALLEDYRLMARDAAILAGLRPEAMVEAGAKVPLHPGAERVYAEAGLLD